MFDFVKSAQTKPISEGVFLIYGAFLDELKNLERGQILRLKGKDGRLYAVVRWEDLVPHDPTTPSTEP